ncbi:MAG: hypothetical protein ACYTG1_08240 [Planctomycetota bacterium]|jgi:hypothetical protein
MSDRMKTGEPYCGNCGHRLSGCVDSSKCPECGRPIVEVLTRAGRWGRRYRSRATLFGLPLVDVALGSTPTEQIGRARGVFAIGDRATGLVAVGGIARGLVAAGGVAIGGVSLGGVSVGLLGAWGGLALGAMAHGGMALGVLSAGGIAAGYAASGGLAIGWHAVGGAPVGAHTVGPGANDQAAVDVFTSLGWFFGPPQFSKMSLLQPMLAIVALGAAITGGVGLLAALASLRGGPPGEEPRP